MSMFCKFSKIHLLLQEHFYDAGLVTTCQRLKYPIQKSITATYI